MTLKEQMATDANAVFLNTDDFAEEVVYRPLNGKPRKIKAVVDREVPTELAGSPAPVIRLEVANSATDGIAVEDLDTGGDKIDVAEKYGGEVKQRSISKLMGHDHQMLTIEVR